MTGTGRGGDAIPFGHGVDKDRVQAVLAQLARRPGLEGLDAFREGRFAGVYHQFFKSPLNVVGIEYFATLLHPSLAQELRPDETYRDALHRFTRLPLTSFTFFAMPAVLL